LNLLLVGTKSSSFITLHAFETAFPTNSFKVRQQGGIEKYGFIRSGCLDYHPRVSVEKSPVVHPLRNKYAPRATILIAIRNAILAQLRF
jgi:hypothetical protein